MLLLAVVFVIVLSIDIAFEIGAYTVLDESCRGGLDSQRCFQPILVRGNDAARLLSLGY